eukprot:6209647-Pleurochrysis_carterae.AAC.1
MQRLRRVELPKPSTLARHLRASNASPDRSPARQLAPLRRLEHVRTSEQQRVPVALAYIRARSVWRTPHC